MYRHIIILDKESKKVEWSVNSVDILLGLIGGFIGLIWDLLDLSFRPYESFKFGTALISEIYTTTSRSRMTTGKEPNNL